MITVPQYSSTSAREYRVSRPLFELFLFSLDMMF